MIGPSRTTPSATSPATMSDTVGLAIPSARASSARDVGPPRLIASRTSERLSERMVPGAAGSFGSVSIPA